MVTNSIVVAILESFFFIPITEEVRECTSQRTISAYVVYYSDFDQDVNAFISVDYLKTKVNASR